MGNPYRDLPHTAFWKRAVAAPDPGDVDPVSPPPFRIHETDRIATAGSCFAQHIARTLKQKGFRYLETETGPVERNFGVFSARFGNLYTTRQLLQLFQRAYGLFEPADLAWRHGDRFVDPFRPQVEPDGYETVEDVLRDRDMHLAAVRRMFEDCDVFVFTLGLTEGWRSKVDGAVFPLAPGVTGRPDDMQQYEFHNFTVAEMTADLQTFIAYLRTVNRDARLVFTVSPVPLVATYEPRHVLVSTIYSKSALRVVAEEITRSTANAAYYPSYEIITGHHTRYGFFEDDLRGISNAGVDRAMLLFSQHYLHDEPAQPPMHAVAPASLHSAERKKHDADELYRVVCDEEAIET
jgi:hypothetical protein